MADDGRHDVACHHVYAAQKEAQDEIEMRVPRVAVHEREYRGLRHQRPARAEAGGERRLAESAEIYLLAYAGQDAQHEQFQDERRRAARCHQVFHRGLDIGRKRQDNLARRRHVIDDGRRGERSENEHRHIERTRSSHRNESSEIIFEREDEGEWDAQDRYDLIRHDAGQHAFSAEHRMHRKLHGRDDDHGQEHELHRRNRHPRAEQYAKETVHLNVHSHIFTHQLIFLITSLKVF